MFEEGRITTVPPVAGTGAIQPGRRIGKYEILHHMATGGMAEIYLARASGIENFEKLVVLKRILPSAAADPDSIRMLLDEARIAATLHHSNIVQVFDIGQADGEYFICMEYLHGRNVATLTAAMRRRHGTPVDEATALSIVLGVCAGLHYAHDKTDEHDQPLGIVHRDVSPHNVIVTYDGGVKLVDFGLVKAAGRATESRSGTLKGKLAYMSPEQCRVKPCDRRSDVFALSILLWELTTGCRLYTGECDYDFLSAILESDAPKPSTVIPGYPVALERIVMKGLERDMDARWQSAEAMQIELEEYARERRLKVSPITLRRTMEELFADEIRASKSGQHVFERVGDVSLGAGSAFGPGSGTQPAVTRPGRITAPRTVARPATGRRAWLAAAGVAVAAIAVAAYVASGHDPERSTPAVAPLVEPTVIAPKPVAPVAVAPKPSEPAAVTPKPIEPVASKPAAAVTIAPAQRAPSAHKPVPATRPVTADPPKPAADHDSLFPQ